MRNSKRILSFLICMGIVGTMVSQGNPVETKANAETASEQLIVNSSFELGTVGSLPDSWSVLAGSDTANSSAVVSQDAGYIANGKYALKMSYQGNSTFGVISNAVKVIPGETYRLNLLSKSPAATGKYSTYLNYYDASGRQIATSPTYGTTGSTSWSYITTNSKDILATTAPADADTARYVIVLGQADTATNATIYFDEARLNHLDPTVKSVPNSSFENGVDDTGLPVGFETWEWTDAEKGTQTVTSEKAYDGTYSVKLQTLKGSGQNSIRSGLVAATANTNYNFSARIYTAGGLQPVLRAIAFDSNGAQLAITDLTTSQTGVWEKAKKTWTTPANTAYVSVMVYQNRGLDGLAYVDCMSVVPTADDAEDAINTSIQNPGFEGGVQSNGYPVGWNLWPSNAKSKVSIDTTTVHTDAGYTGSHSLQLVDDSTTATSGIASDPVQVISGKKYRATVWVYNESGSGVSLYINFYKSKADALAGSNRISTTVPNTTCSKLSSWEQVKAEGIAPAGAVCATVGFYMGVGSVAISDLDDISFIQVPDTVCYDSLQNPDFENGNTETGDIKSWTKYNAASNVELSAEIAYTGTHSLKMSAEAPNSDGCGVRSDAVSVTPGINYQAKAMIYNKIGTSDIYLEFWNASGRLSVSVADSSRTGEWQEVTVDGTAPSGATYATILFYQPSSVSGITYMDDLSLAPYTPASEQLRHFTSSSNAHPKVYFSDVESLRSKAADTEKTAMGYSGSDLAGKIIALADNYMQETSFVDSVQGVYGGNQSITVQIPPVQQVVSPAQPSGYSNYPFWTAISTGLEDRMETLSMAYNLTGEETYARKAVDIAVAMAGWTTWHDPADTSVTTNLDTAHIVFGVSSVYDLCYDYMTQEEIQKLQNALIHLGLDPLYTDAEEKVDHNIQALRASALTTGALALIGDIDSSVTDKYLTRATDYFNWYLQERAESGNQEGFGYTSYALENMVDAFDQLARVTGDNEYVSNDFLNNTLVKWIVSFSAPGSYSLAKVSDFDGGTEFYQTLSVLANNGNGLAGWYLANAKPGNSVLLTKQFLYLNKSMPIEQPSDALSTSAVLNQIGWGSERTGWEASDTVLGLISNNTGLGHNHYDQNSFLMATNGTWIADDPGYSTFDKTKSNILGFNSWVGHNTILVDWVKNTTQGSQVYKGGGSITSNISTPEYSYMIGSAAEAYGENVLSLFDRHAIMVNHSGRPYFVLFDDLNSAQPRTYTWSLYAGGVWDGLSVDGQSVANIESSETGNLLKVSRNFTNLYARFIGNNPLQIDTGMYQADAGQDSVGPYIHVSNQNKAGNYNFMAVLNTYSDGYIIPASVFQPSVVSDSGCTDTLSGDIALFRGENGVGAKVSYSFDVSEDGTYDLSLITPRSYVYGIYQISIDGVNVGDPFDGYNATVTYNNVNQLGQIALKAGKHTISLTCTGKNENSTKTMIGVEGIKLKNVNTDSSTDNAVQVSQNIDDANALGAVVDYAADAHDLILFNRTASSISEANASTDAKQISLVGVKADGSMEGIGMNSGSNVAYNGRSLITSTAAVSLYMDYTSNTLTVNSQSDADVTVFLKGGAVTSKVHTGNNEISLAADYSQVDAALAKVPSDLSGYTDASVKALSEAVAAVIRDCDVSRQAEVDAMASAIEAAVKNLAPIPAKVSADYSKVDAALAKVPADLSGYTDASVKALSKAVAAVVRGCDVSRQAEVDAMASAIETAVKGLVLVPVRISDDGSGIVLEGAAGVVPSGTTISARQITQGAQFDQIQQTLSGAEQFLLLDISLLSHGVKIEPNGKVTVTMPVPSGYDTNRLALYHIADDGTIENIPFTVEDGKIQFTTERFSAYVIAETKRTQSSPKTGDQTNLPLVFGLAIASLASLFGIVALTVKRRKKYHC